MLYPAEAGSGAGVAVVAMAGGLTDPDIQGALDVVVGSEYQLITTHLNDATSAQALIEAIPPAPRLPSNLGNTINTTA